MRPRILSAHFLSTSSIKLRALTMYNPLYSPSYFIFFLPSLSLSRLPPPPPRWPKPIDGLLYNEPIASLPLRWPEPVVSLFHSDSIALYPFKIQAPTKKSSPLFKSLAPLRTIAHLKSSYKSISFNYF